jgi:hypothetical protein
MATFFAGETLVNAITVNGSSNVGQTVYTVPANRYAKIYLQRFTSFQSGTITIGSLSFLLPGSALSGPTEKSLILYAGQSISFNPNTSSSSNFDWYLVVREFSVP